MNDIEKKLHEEVKRYKEINKYALTLMEQAEPEPTPLTPPPGEEVPPVPGANAGTTPPPPGADAGVPPVPGAEGDVPPVPGEETPPETEAGSVTPPESDDTTEDIDVTELVNMTKNIKQELESSKTDNSGVIEKMDGVFNKLSELEGKLADMDNIIAKIDELGSKVEQMKPPTPVEKLEMRSLDSYPFNQKPDEFFAEKQQQMRDTGKNEYVLTKDDVMNYNKEDIKQSFNDKLKDADQF